MTTAIIITLVITHATMFSAGFFVGAVWVAMFRLQEPDDAETDDHDALQEWLDAGCPVVRAKLLQ